MVDRFRFAWSTISERGAPPFPISLVDSTELRTTAAVARELLGFLGAVARAVEGGADVTETSAA